MPAELPESDREMLAHAMPDFANLETMDYLRSECRATTARLQATWADLVRRAAGADDVAPFIVPGPAVRTEF